MYRTAVKYHSTWLAPGSKGLEMYNAKQIKELDAHLKEMARKEQKLLDTK